MVTDSSIFFQPVQSNTPFYSSKSKLSVADMKKINMVLSNTAKHFVSD